MKSKYTYFVSYAFDNNNVSMTIDLNGKLDTPEKINNLCHGIANHHEADGVSLNNFILLSETHEPEKSDNVKDALTELHEWMVKYDAQIENDHVAGEVSIYAGDNECIKVTNDIIDTDDIKAKILEL